MKPPFTPKESPASSDKPAMPRMMSISDDPANPLGAEDSSEVKFQELTSSLSIDEKRQLCDWLSEQLMAYEEEGMEESPADDSPLGEDEEDQASITA